MNKCFINKSVINKSAINKFVIPAILTLPILSCSETKVQLPKLNLDKSSITVSGISSGGYMAHQYHIAYSDQVSGAALLASGPYGCAQGDLKTALADCVNSETPPKIENTLQEIRTLAANKEIASLDNLKDNRVWIFHGANDTRVSLAVTESQNVLYKALGALTQLEYELDAGHGFPTEKFGVECGLTKSPHINQCDYDGAGQLLSYLYQNISSKSEQLNSLTSFNQALFLDEEAENTLADTGYLYIPEPCAKGELCQLHIAFHGCLQNEENIGRTFVENAGYNTWAEANNIVVLYPQTKSSYMPLNPKACWDWWGYTGADYQTRNGAQLKHINNMVLKL